MALFRPRIAGRGTGELVIARRDVMRIVAQQPALRADLHTALGARLIVDNVIEGMFGPQPTLDQRFAVYASAAVGRGVWALGDVPEYVLRGIVDRPVASELGRLDRVMGQHQLSTLSGSGGNQPGTTGNRLSARKPEFTGRFKIGTSAMSCAHAVAHRRIRRQEPLFVTGRSDSRRLPRKQCRCAAMASVSSAPPWM